MNGGMNLSLVVGHSALSSFIRGLLRRVFVYTYHEIMEINIGHGRVRDNGSEHKKP
jgi:hypothetical protein